jgi:hypothetical protein
LDSRYSCGVAGLLSISGQHGRQKRNPPANFQQVRAHRTNQGELIMFRIHAVIAVAIACPAVALAQASMRAEPSPQQKQVVADFEKRVNDYLALRKTNAGTAPNPTDSAQKLEETQKELAKRVRVARANAKQGNIFTPEITQYFRKTIAKTFTGKQGAKILASLRHAEPVKGFKLEVNGVYPPDVPLQSTAPSLLANLPPLPKELEYRIVNRDLVLHDIAANLIVDFMPHAIRAT